MLGATDTPEVYDQLKETFTDEQAHDLSRIFSLTGSDKLFVTREIEELKRQGAETQKSIKELEFKIVEMQGDIVEMQGGLKELEAKMQSGYQELELKIAKSKNEILKWTTGFFLVQTGILAGIFVAAIKLL